MTDTNTNANSTLLKVLLVLTFIYAGISCIAYLGMAATLPNVRAVYAEQGSIIPTELHTMMEMYLDLPRGYYLTAGFLFAAELAGAVLMWSLRPSGFHCYTMARLLLLLVPLLFLGKGFLGIGDVMMAALYILIYWMLMRRLGAFDRHDDNASPTVAE